jgi:hypothetical protein
MVRRLAGVYQDEMKPFGKISEQDLDRLFSGKAPTESSGLNDISGLVHVVQNRFSADIDAGLESTHLTALMQMVNSTDKGDLAARPASKVTGPESQASGLPKLRRKFMLESLFATLAGKIAAGSMAVVLAAVPVAATGHLPDEMQTGISEAVENVGINIPLGDTAEDALEAVEELDDEIVDDVVDDVTDGDTDGETDGDTDDTDGEEDTEGDTDGGAKTPNGNSAFGQAVAADARDGGVDGQEISAAAHARNEARKAARGNQPTPSPTPTVEPTDDPTDTDDDDDAGAQRAGNGGGKPAGVGGGRR